MSVSFINFFSQYYKRFYKTINELTDSINNGDTT